jgi:hypothetical protein
MSKISPINFLKALNENVTRIPRDWAARQDMPRNASKDLDQLEELENQIRDVAATLARGGTVGEVRASLAKFESLLSTKAEIRERLKVQLSTLASIPDSLAEASNAATHLAPVLKEITNHWHDLPERAQAALVKAGPLFQFAG